MNMGRIALWIVIILATGFWLVIGINSAVSIADFGGPLALWLTTVLGVISLLMLASSRINNQWLGILIDNRNKFSLSRLQMALWTVAVMSAYLVMAFTRIIALEHTSLTQEQALDITFPPELLLAMGISAASFAGSTLIKQTKTTKTMTIAENQTPEAEEVRRDNAKTALEEAEKNLLEKAQAKLDAQQRRDAAKSAFDSAPDATKTQTKKDLDKEQALFEFANVEERTATQNRDAKKKELEKADKNLVAIQDAQGRLHRNADPADASWVDLFRGEEISNYKLVDMSKVQMMFFTVVVIVVYGAGIASLLKGNLIDAKGLSFPPFGDTLNALLGISHGTYLSVKAVDQN